ncbi:MAG: pyruvate kinase [Anaerosomatales bacterium]|nr:pyruvate kinase [Anaerosomatales bacterium]
MRRTKIVATIGPATDAPATLEALVRAGLDVARLNASHSTREQLERRLQAVRAASETVGRHVAVMLDLGGPKLRVGEMAEDTVLAEGAEFDLVAGECVGDGRRACISYPRLAADVEPGARILLDDGKVQLRVTATADEAVRTVVERGGAVASHKGVNVPSVRLRVEPVTEADSADLAWGLSAGIDIVAQSFVRSAQDVRALRELMGDAAVPIVAKIEKHEAVAEIDAIAEAADIVMVARGDLGVETSAEDVPVIQRRIIDVCRASGTPVVIATQMLESMTSQLRPTRAEASDIANAVFDGVDALMLSAETAIGRHPVPALETMVRIARTAEEGMAAEGLGPAQREARGGGDVTAAVSAAVCQLAAELDIAGIVTATQSGATARAVASHRPSVPIVAMTPDARVARQLAVVWGVLPAIVPEQDTIDAMLDAGIEVARAVGVAENGDLVALTAGVAVNVPGTTDLIQVRRA